MAKKKILKVPLDFSSKLKIPKDAINAIKSSIKSGEISLSIDLVSIKKPDLSLGFFVYPDGVKGTLKFTMEGEHLIIDSSAIYEMEIGKFEEDSLKLPVLVKFTSVGDENADSYYFGEDELGILTDVKLDSFS